MQKSIKSLHLGLVFLILCLFGNIPIGFGANSSKIILQEEKNISKVHVPVKKKTKNSRISTGSQRQQKDLGTDLLWLLIGVGFLALVALVGLIILFIKLGTLSLFVLLGILVVVLLINWIRHLQDVEYRIFLRELRMKRRAAKRKYK